MEASEFLKLKKELLDRKKKIEDEINAEFTVHVQRFLDANSPVEKGKVYEIEEGSKRRGYKRFIIYDVQPKFMFDTLSISVGGWWLNKDSVPEKWDTRYVWGIGNPTVFRLSEDQKSQPHPNSNYKLT